MDNKLHYKIYKLLLLNSLKHKLKILFKHKNNNIKHKKKI